jgi:hypothetical protein
MSYKIEIYKKDLIKLFIKEHLSAYEIADKYNCSNVTILNWIRKYNLGKFIKIGYPKGRKNPKISGNLSPTKRLEVRQKMIKNHADFSGNKNPNHGATWMIGDKNPNWKGGITSFNHQLRNSDKYNDWRIRVYKKDHFTCKSCKEIGKNLHAHHIISWSILIKEFLNKYNYLSVINDRNKLVELALKDKKLWNVNNGITYCDKCHSEEHPSMNYII